MVWDTLMVFIYLPSDFFVFFAVIPPSLCTRYTDSGTNCAYSARFLIRILPIRVNTVSPRLRRRVSGGSPVIKTTFPTETIAPSDIFLSFQP